MNKKETAEAQALIESALSGSPELEIEAVFPKPGVVPSGGVPEPKSFHAAWGGPKGYGQVVKLEDALAYAASSNAQLQQELRSIDEALARRPALSDLKHRYDKVYRACEMAGRAETAESEVSTLEGELREARQEIEAAAIFSLDTEQLRNQIKSLKAELERLRAGERG